MLKRNERGSKVMPERLRIQFRDTQYAADQDKNTFNLYRTRQISAEEGALRVSRNNTCPCTKEQFIANAEWLCWI